MDWELKKELKEQLAREQGYYRYPAGTRERFALVYPNSYFVGMSNLGLHIIYDLLNRRDDTACERFFLPDKDKIACYENTRTPLMSLENQTPLADFPVIGFAVSFEMDDFNVIKILELGHVPVRAAERGVRAPLVIAGGPCATFNPEPLSSVVDAFIIGEGEVIMPAFMDAYYEAQAAGATRAELLQRLAHVPGVYVPSLYEHRYEADGRIAAIVPQAGAPERVARQWVKDLDAWPAHTVVVTEDTEFNLYLIETARGCGRHCRFCMAGYCFRVPRNRSLGVIHDEVKDALAYQKRIGLMGAAISDYPEIDALCKDILGEGLSMSVASFRADSVTEELVASLAKSGLQTLTMAPEAGSKKLRAVINKGIEEEHLFHAMELGIKAGIPNYRLYLMIGLPFETEEDIDAIIDLANRLKDYMEAHGARGRLTLSINPFIPKPFTPFQWKPMCDKKTVERRLKHIEQALKRRKNIHIIAESPRSAYVQGVLARGDRRVADVLVRACELGGAKAFKRAMKEAKLDPAFYLSRERAEDETFPWERLDMGFRKSYLYGELKNAEALRPTIPCFDGCHRCGVC
ncbi:TIGR03960 family B12-binding radical SAM protein [Selenomonas sp.]|uniref:TIGR03960 family B12-binding radical SAM protein n=2 Tax=Selenomonas sp. TaxID=2053611 RepID=UPI002A7600A4|nr:TIGR03960 family B12-binding radical SAM protein [Selenomonas sp.]MDY3298055.1 TIGR03960 family B12-binding radical SAM protein [Selenomonas sp.]MDY4416265.1 TIGR03960 family B12-binding radical SAM protein [Selenomonas sp.]